MTLPDFEAWAVFAKVAETGSFARAAPALGVSGPTVSKAIARLEKRLGTQLLHRTSRRLSLTQTGQGAFEQARRILATGEALEADVSDQASTPRGVVRVAAPMSFGVAARRGRCCRNSWSNILLEVGIDLHLSDAQQVDREPAAAFVPWPWRIAKLTGRLRPCGPAARRCTKVLPPAGRPRPGYFQRHGRPTHPRDLEQHRALIYTNTPSPTSGASSTRRKASSPSGPRRLPREQRRSPDPRPAARHGRGDAARSSLVWRELANSRLEEALPGLGGCPRSRSTSSARQALSGRPA